ncbi:MAG TPA: primosomal protein N' [Patescibacteria group bacterium]|jgi:primosomal protein N' (replication factor Y)|nr:primosomal protein N' [Patescibacteria group bacterium]
MQYYLVAPTSIVRKDQDAYTYHHEDELPIGTVVKVSVNKRILIAVIIAKVSKRPVFETKPIVTTLINQPLPGPLLDLANWVSAYYATPLAIVLQTFLPTGIDKKRRLTEHQTESATRHRTNILLNAEQARAVTAFTNKKSGTCILHGVTGSGKTQIYIELAKKQYAANKSSIILAPEIALTPQLIAEFKNHFKNVVFTHSGMTEVQRHLAWLQCLNANTPLIVIGPRSALFMPLADIGLIVLDECHEPSYKQEQSPRYSALRAATMLGRFHDALVVFGSATPTVSDYYVAELTKAPIVELMSTAIKTPTPEIELVDNKNRDKFRRHQFLSDALLETIDQTIKDKKQVLIFHNRRGTASAILCKQCQWQALCPTCQIPQTLHADQYKLVCHICGKNQSMVSSCPICHQPDVVIQGVGTKLIEEALNKLFPHSRIARFDADNTKDTTIQSRYQELYDGDIDIIIGTQLLAKGLDLPNLRAVGIIQADIGLYLPDYQAEERVFQLIYQVAGRIGRTDHKTKLVVQTYLPEHKIIQQAISRNFKSFYNQQLQNRKSMQFPPFIYLLKLTCSYKTELGAIRAAKRMASDLKSQWPNVTILGPAPAFYERLHGNYRWQLIIKSKQRANIVAIAKASPPKWQADLDPATIL